jgi:hypothetical protein
MEKRMKFKRLITNTLILLSILVGSLEAARWIKVQTAQEIAQKKSTKYARAAKNLTPELIQSEADTFDLYRKNIEEWKQLLENKNENEYLKIEKEAYQQEEELAQIVECLHHNVLIKSNLENKKTSLLRKQSQTKNIKKRHMIDREIAQLDDRLSFSEKKISHEEVALYLLDETAKISVQSITMKARQLVSSIEQDLSILEKKCNQSNQ